MGEPAREGVPPWTLGWRLQRALDWGGLSVQQMADKLAMSRSAVSGWLNDRHRPKTLYLRTWAALCKVPEDWLIYGDSTTRSADFHPDQAERSTKADLLSYTKQLRQAIPSNPNRRSRLWLIS